MRTSSFLIAIACLFSLSAAAQVSTRWSWQPDEQSNFSRSDCGSTNITMVWEVSGGNGSAADMYMVYQPDGTCHTLAAIPGTTIIARSEAVGAGTLLIDDVVSAEDFLPAGACGEEGIRQTAGAMCFYVYELGRTDAGGLLDNERVAIFVDTIVPEVAEITNIDARDASIQFEVNADAGKPDESFTRLIQARACDNGSLEVTLPSVFTATSDDDEEDDEDEEEVPQADSICGADGDFVQVEFDGPTISTSGYTDGADYEFRAALVDDFGNVGAFGEAIVITPSPEEGALSIYNGNGTPYGFSCASSDKAPTLFFVGFALLLGLFGFRRKRKTQALATSLMCLTFAMPSLAQDLAELEPPKTEPDTGVFGGTSVEIYGGPYLPNLDSEQVNGQNVRPFYRCIFDDAILPELGGAADFHLFDLFGSVQLGVGFSASQANGLAFPKGHFDTDTSFECSEASSSGRSQLTILKLRPRLTYRFDWLLDTYNIPLVPYAQLGITGTTYIFTRNGSFDESREGVEPAGVVFGTEANLGMMLSLEFLDRINFFTPNTIRRAKARGTFKYAFFFAEAGLNNFDNFGANGFVFSPRDVLTGTGLPLQYRFGIGLEIP